MPLFGKPGVFLKLATVRPRLRGIYSSKVFGIVPSLVEAKVVVTAVLDYGKRGVFWRLLKETMQQLDVASVER